MGRLQGAALRAKKRANAAAAELVDQSAKWAEVQSLAQTPNEELFVLDTTALPVPNHVQLAMAKAAAAEAAASKSKGTSKKHSIPKLQQKKVEEMLAKHDPKTLQEMVKKDTTTRGRRRSAKGQLPTKDLWQDSEEDTNHVKEKDQSSGNKKGIMTQLAGIAPEHTSSFRNVRGFDQKTAGRTNANTTRKAVAVQIALAGQSYHPDPQQHQDVIGEALALELRRQQMETYVNTPISNGMNEETKALLVTDDQDVEESDEEDDDNEDAKNETRLSKITLRREKLTRAQRNKQKRIRAEQAEIQQRKRAKKFLHQVQEAKKIKREIIQEEITKQQRRELIQQEKQQQKSQEMLGVNLIQKQFHKNPLDAPSLPVALSSDFAPASTVTSSNAAAGPSLRTLHPKGSLVSERMMSFRDRQLVIDSSKHTGKDRKFVQGKKRKMRIKGKGFNYGPADADFKLLG